MAEKYYRIHFFDEETGENFYHGFFETKEELCESREWEYPGYGTREIVEISRKEALKALVEEIDESIAAACEAYEDFDDLSYEDLWFGQLECRIANEEPGWKILKEEFES